MITMAYDSRLFNGQTLPSLRLTCACGLGVTVTGEARMTPAALLARAATAWGIDPADPEAGVCSVCQEHEAGRHDAAFAYPAFEPPADAPFDVQAKAYAVWDQARALWAHRKAVCRRCAPGA